MFSHRRRFFIIAATIALLVALNSQALNSPVLNSPVLNSQAFQARGSADDIQQQISDLLDQYSKALLEKDVAALDRIWADDLSFINLHGELLSKANRIDNIKTGATSFKSTEVSEKKVRSYGDAAVATCKVVLEAQYSGHEGSGAYRVTTVWAQPKGSWQMVAVQMTRIE